MIEFDCPQCGCPLALEDKLAGKQHECPECGASIGVPCPEHAPAEGANEGQDSPERLAKQLGEERQNRLTLERRLAEAEAQLAEAQQSAGRSGLAVELGIASLGAQSTEPESAPGASGSFQDWFSETDLRMRLAEGLLPSTRPTTAPPEIVEEITVAGALGAESVSSQPAPLETAQEALDVEPELTPAQETAPPEPVAVPEEETAAPPEEPPKEETPAPEAHEEEPLSLDDGSFPFGPVPEKTPPLETVGLSPAPPAETPAAEAPVLELEESPFGPVPEEAQGDAPPLEVKDSPLEAAPTPPDVPRAPQSQAAHGESSAALGGIDHQEHEAAVSSLADALRAWGDDEQPVETQEASQGEEANDNVAAALEMWGGGGEETNETPVSGPPAEDLVPAETAAGDGETEEIAAALEGWGTEEGEEESSADDRSEAPPQTLEAAPELIPLDEEGAASLSLEPIEEIEEAQALPEEKEEEIAREPAEVAAESEQLAADTLAVEGDFIPDASALEELAEEPSVEAPPTETVLGDFIPETSTLEELSPDVEEGDVVEDALSSEEEGEALEPAATAETDKEQESISSILQQWSGIQPRSEVAEPDMMEDADAEPMLRYFPPPRRPERGGKKAMAEALERFMRRG